MKTIKINIIFCCFILLSITKLIAQNHSLFDNRPAEYFEECFPLGNGRIGASPNGKLKEETIILNDITLWSGKKEDANNYKAAKYLKEIQNLIAQNKNDIAQDLMYQKFVCTGKGSGYANGQNIPYGSYQMLGKLKFIIPSVDSCSSLYSRNLDISKAIYKNTFYSNKNKIEKKYFTSFSDDIFVMQINAKSKIPLTIKFDRDTNCIFDKIDNNILKISGYVSNGNDSIGMRYVIFIGTNSPCEIYNNTIAIKQTTNCKTIVSWGTNYADNNFEETNLQKLKSALNSNFEKLEQQHIAAYRNKYNKVSISIGKEKKLNLTTKERLIKFQTDSSDLSLINLYFNYGRYLFISSCRENLLPPNLQGLWANTFQTPWNGDYHLNINLQMNHWFAEVCGLGDLHKPLINLTKRLSQEGVSTAKAFYNAEGWVTHVITNIWGFTAPGEHPSWGATNTCGAWLCRDLWQHFEYSNDTTFLQDIFPIIEGAAIFFETTLFFDSSKNLYVTSPSTSPENSFYLKNSKKIASVCMGPTIDAQILRELFQNYIEAAKILNIHNEKIEKIKSILPKLPPTKIGSKGQIMEWLEDYEEVEPQHRHVSHLYGLYPANQINPTSTPELADAAKKTLEIRGDGGTGWSIAWKINFWARLYDGNRAAKLLKNLLQPAFDTTGKLNIGGTYPNLFCSHPPFQIDGNFGGTAGIVEMLLQNTTNEINYIPALPSNWENGCFKNLRLKNNASTNAEWKNNKLTKTIIYANSDANFKIRCNQKIKNIKINNKQIKPNIADNILNIELKKGENLKIKWIRK